MVGWGGKKGTVQERVQNLFGYTLLGSNFFEIDTVRNIHVFILILYMLNCT